MNASEVLAPFGFTGLESEIYMFLAKESPATGYRIAQGINKPAANTYKGIQGLQSKGAIMVEEGATRLCRPVPLPELLKRLQRDFATRTKTLEKALANAATPSEDDRVYVLRSVDQVLAKVSEMLGSAKRGALLKLPGRISTQLEPDLAELQKREIQVALLTDSPASSGGMETTVASLSAGATTVVVDGSEVLIGTVDTESASVWWTRNPAVAGPIQSGLACEIVLAQVEQLLAADEKKSRIQKALESGRLLQNFQE